MLPDLSREQLLGLYRRMLVMRRFEERVIVLSQEHAIGHFHVYIGQECTGAPALWLVRPGDFLFTTHRNHGHLLARGADPGRMLAEILGKATGYNRGKGGTLHVCARELGFLTTSAVVGGIVPLAAGAALAAKRKGTDGVGVSLFGDGALEEGVFYEAVNIASLWKLPVIFLCENNSREALGPKAGDYPSSTIAARRLTDLTRAFRIPASRVDGTDAGAVYRAMKKAVTRARRGEGPSFIEALTLRWPGSRPLWPELVTGETDIRLAWDQGRIPHEHSEWHRSQDGLLRFTRELIQAGHVDQARALDLDREVRDEIEAAVRFAIESPYPRPEDALEDVSA